MMSDDDEQWFRTDAFVQRICATIQAYDGRIQMLQKLIPIARMEYGGDSDGIPTAVQSITSDTSSIHSYNKNERMYDPGMHSLRSTISEGMSVQLETTINSTGSEIPYDVQSAIPDFSTGTNTPNTQFSANSSSILESERSGLRQLESSLARALEYFPVDDLVLTDHTSSQASYVSRQHISDSIPTGASSVTGVESEIANVTAISTDVESNKASIEDVHDNCNVSSPQESLHATEAADVSSEADILNGATSWSQSASHAPTESYEPMSENVSTLNEVELAISKLDALIEEDTMYDYSESHPSESAMNSFETCKSSHVSLEDIGAQRVQSENCSTQIDYMSSSNNPCSPTSEYLQAVLPSENSSSCKQSDSRYSPSPSILTSIDSIESGVPLSFEDVLPVHLRAEYLRESSSPLDTLLNTGIQERTGNTNWITQQLNFMQHVLMPHRSSHNFTFSDDQFTDSDTSTTKRYHVDPNDSVEFSDRS